MTPAHPSARRHPPQKAAVAVGAVFLVIGLAGFVPGITTHFDLLEFSGSHSGARLFDVFAISVLHNVVHLAFGAIGILAGAASPAASRVFLMVGGGIYLLLSVYGLGTADHPGANFLPVNHADNWLHLGLGAGMIALGLLTTAIERKRGDYPEPEIQHQ
ncbi:hypothetical protein BS329_01550 [Amycolatopsis coloradensis]|uniref:DUF4383 domain-containing protein n=1 Tax=Amycolatopsis coloradensis TaxID=76021 RepID=A0A1R0L3W3_9PSEU|nr:DUF4383 domain-containing protein [Amycolatopsis coloradensis]OLZ57383.1 hypothetical protein BS329_01550 [Amycolatopsis coloradensis]